MQRIRISPDPIDPAAELEAFTRKSAGSGAIVSFTGQVRSSSPGGKVVKLHLQSHPVLTQSAICDAFTDSPVLSSATDWRVVHRTGDIPAGETIVLVAAAADHRRAAFEAADFMMDYLKTEAIFWKKEICEQTSAWIEPRAQDYADRSRWDNHGR